MIVLFSLERIIVPNSQSVPDHHADLRHFSLMDLLMRIFPTLLLFGGA